MKGLGYRTEKGQGLSRKEVFKWEEKVVSKLVKRYI